MSNHLKEIKQCVTFIFVRNSIGDFVANGTGFFVGVKKDDNSDIYTPYLVTSKHVLQDAKGQIFPEVAIRLNTKAGDSKLTIIPLSGERGAKVYTHEDTDVDIACFNCVPSQDIYEFKFIQDSLLATAETLKEYDISEGDDVFFSGLFASYVGQKRNQPIIRFGKVALLPDEKVEWGIGGGHPTKMLDLYLLECQSYGGNSGSPVFFQLNPFKNLSEIKPSKIFLAGVMMGSFLNGNEVQVIETGFKSISLQNIGIAAVVPAYKLYELLFSAEVVKDRNNSKKSEVTNV